MNKKMIFLGLINIFIGITLSASMSPNFGLKIKTITVWPDEKDSTSWYRDQNFLRRKSPQSGKKQVQSVTIYYKNKAVTVREVCSIITDVYITYNPKQPVLVLRKKWEQDFDLFNTQQKGSENTTFYWQGAGHLDTWGKIFHIYYPHPHANPKCYARQRIAQSIGGTTAEVPQHVQALHHSLNQF